MSHIFIERSHEQTADEARRAVESLAQELTDRFGISYHWQDDSLYFERAGVKGQIELEPGMVRIDARLGFLLAAFKYQLEQEIHREMDQLFQSAPDSA